MLLVTVTSGPIPDQQRNNVIMSYTFPGLVAEYCLWDIFTIDLTQMEFRWSPVVGESTEETFEEIVSNNDDATEKMQPIVVAVTERYCLGYNQQYAVFR